MGGPFSIVSPRRIPLARWRNKVPLAVGPSPGNPSVLLNAVVTQLLSWYHKPRAAQKETNHQQWEQEQALKKILTPSHLDLGHLHDRRRGLGHDRRRDQHLLFLCRPLNVRRRFLGWRMAKEICH